MKHTRQTYFSSPNFLCLISLSLSALSVCPSVLFLPLSPSLSQPAVGLSQINQFMVSWADQWCGKKLTFRFSVYLCVRARVSVCLYTKQREAVRAKSLSASELMVPSSVAVPPASR